MPGFELIDDKYVIGKSRASILDYGIRLSRWIKPGDSIGASPAPTWVLSDGLTAVEAGYADGIAFVFLAGGAAVGEMSWARCTWTTANGRKETKTLYFHMEDR